MAEFFVEDDELDFDFAELPPELVFWELAADDDCADGLFVPDETLLSIF